MVRSGGTRAAIRPAGSTAAIVAPRMNHHGTPLSIDSTSVPAPIIGAAASTAEASAGALTARISRSCGPSAIASDDRTIVACWVRGPS